MLDVIVIGGGPAGVTAALRARELGATVALVERDQLGSTCTNDGCAPTRVLARAARLMRDGQQFGDYELVGRPSAVDFGQLLARTRETIERLHEKKQLATHLQQAGVTLLTNAGEAAFVDEHTVALADGSKLQGRSIIICAGGQARRFPFPGSEHDPPRRVENEGTASFHGYCRRRSHRLPIGLYLCRLWHRGDAL